MQHRLHHLTVAGALALACAGLLGAPAIATDRATRYFGAQSVAFGDKPAYDAQRAITIEAWVWLESNDAGNCHTIAEHGLGSSFYFAVCPRPMFMRSGASAVTGTTSLPAKRWTHVAVSYDGAIARFYVNGNVAGAYAHAPNLAPGTRNVRLGAVLGFGGQSNWLRGALDEVRVWSVARTQSEIRADMNRELRAAAGLVSAFGAGGTYDDVAGAAAVAVTGVPVRQPFGVLPRELAVPRAATQMSFDGGVNLTGEYAGAEQLALRHPTNASEDGVAFLVHDDDYLYLGLRTTSVAAPGTTATSMTLSMDTTWARSATPQVSDKSIRYRFSDGVARRYEGDGAQWVPVCPVPSRACTQTNTMEVRSTICGGDDVGPVPCLEYRVPRSLLGSWSETDGLLLAQTAVSTTTDNHIAPIGASLNVPSTFAPVSYLSTNATLVPVVVRGVVNQGFSPDAAGPFPGYNVELRAGGQLVAEQATSATGAFSFDGVGVPSGATLAVIIRGGSNQLTQQLVDTSPAFIQPLDNSNVGSVLFPGCTVMTTCRYAPISFFAQAPLPPIVVDHLEDILHPGVTITSTWPSIALRDAPFQASEPATVLLVGANFHPNVEVYLAAPSSQTDPTFWTMERMPHSFIDTNHIEAETPLLDGVAAWSPGWHVVVKDRWPRPGYHVWNALDDDITLVRPPYPTVYGFGFPNEKKSTSSGEFLASYGDNAYICVGAAGYCACRIPDPLYTIFYFAIYKWVLGSIDGSCNGIAATSVLFSQGLLDEQDFDPNVYKPSGYQGCDPDDTAFPCTPIAGPSYDWSFCGVTRPANLWGTIRANHGAQTSAEFLSRFLGQVADNWGGDPRRVLERVQAGGPQVVCFSNEGDPTGGHCVTSYRVAHDEVTPGVSSIYVYDNNQPWLWNGDGQACSQALHIDIDRNANRFSYDNDCDGDIEKQGTLISSYPAEVWINERHMPLDLPAAIWTMLFGDVDASLGVDDGALIADGTGVSSSSPSITIIPSFAAASASSARTARPLAAAIDAASLASGTATLDVVLRDGALRFASAGSSFFSAAVTGAAAGTAAQLRVEVDPLELAATGEARIVGGSVAADVSATAALPVTLHIADGAGGALGSASERAAWHVGPAQVDAGVAVRAARDPASTRRLVVGAVGGALTTNVVLDWVDGPSETSGLVLVGPVDVPADMRVELEATSWPRLDTIEARTLDANGKVVGLATFAPRSCAPTSEAGKDDTPAGSDCDGDGVADLCALARGDDDDANGNGVPDSCDGKLAPRSR